MNILKQIGMRIRYLRKKKGLSQLGLSLEADVNKNYISDLERGTRNPSLVVLSTSNGWPLAMRPNGSWPTAPTA